MGHVSVKSVHGLPPKRLALSERLTNFPVSCTISPSDDVDSVKFAFVEVELVENSDAWSDPPTKEHPNWSLHASQSWNIVPDKSAYVSLKPTT